MELNKYEVEITLTANKNIQGIYDYIDENGSRLMPPITLAGYTIQYLN